MKRIIVVLPIVILSFFAGFLVGKPHTAKYQCDGIYAVGGVQGYICKVPLGRFPNTRQKTVQLTIPGFIPVRPNLQ